MSVRFITSNKDKQAEFSRIVDSIDGIDKMRDEYFDIRYITMDSTEIQGTVEEISMDKCKQFVKWSITDPYLLNDKGVLCEDVSLEFDAMGGLPGPYIKYFNEELGSRGLWNMVHGYSHEHTAVATCVYTYYDFESSKYTQFVGKSEGTIVSPRGEYNIGWDEIFEPSGQSLTFAEMTRVVKDNYSHRADAVKQFIEFFKLRYLKE